MEKEINNSFYNDLGDRWYTAFDDPIALLRAESHLIAPWVSEKIRDWFKDQNVKILDIGCGGGFVSNALAKEGFNVTGIDASVESLNVAKKYDTTQKVAYVTGDANALPFANEAFDVVMAMDFLEHVANPFQVIKEASRVLKTGGVFFFHTFNRNKISYFVGIKFVEWFIKNTPKNFHVLKYFITPEEMNDYLKTSSFNIVEMRGLSPNWTTLDFASILRRHVSPHFGFKWTKSQLISYAGCAQKVLQRL